MDFPRVAHIVADLDELGFGVPDRRPRRALRFRRVAAAVQRLFGQRRLAAWTAMTAIVMAVAA